MASDGQHKLFSGTVARAEDWSRNRSDEGAQPGAEARSPDRRFRRGMSHRRKPVRIEIDAPKGYLGISWPELPE